MSSVLLYSRTTCDMTEMPESTYARTACVLAFAVTVSDTTTTLRMQPCHRRRYRVTNSTFLALDDHEIECMWQHCQVDRTDSASSQRARGLGGCITTIIPAPYRRRECQHFRPLRGRRSKALQHPPVRRHVEPTGMVGRRCRSDDPVYSTNGLHS